MFIIGIKTTNNQIGFFTGDGFDTEPSKSRVYANKGIATIRAQKFIDVNGVKKVVIVHAPKGVFKSQIISFVDRTRGLVKKKKAVKKKAAKKKNPIAGSRKRRIKKAENLYKDFTGHEVDTHEIVDIPEYDTGLKIGQCLGILYETTRDGKRERYIHEFKRNSRPDLAVSHNGQQLFLIGGNYLFKDDGINDI